MSYYSDKKKKLSFVEFVENVGIFGMIWTVGFLGFFVAGKISIKELNRIKMINRKMISQRMLNPKDITKNQNKIEIIESLNKIDIESHLSALISEINKRDNVSVYNFSKEYSGHYHIYINETQLLYDIYNILYNLNDRLNKIEYNDDL